jgi:hypothetical protein
MFMRRLSLALVTVPLLLVLGAARAEAAPVLAAAHSIAGGSATTRVDPVERTFTIATAGTYNVTLTDDQIPAAFDLLTLAVTSGATVVATATVGAGGAPAIAHLNAPVGTYQVHVIAGLATGELFGTTTVTLTDSSNMPVNAFPGPGNTLVPTFTATLSVPPGAVSADARLIDRTFTATAGDTIELDLTDLQFPAALGTLTVNLADPNGTPVAGFPVSAAGGAQTVTFTAISGNYHLVGGAQAGAGAAGGLFNVRVLDTNSGSDLLPSGAEALGQVTAAGSATLSAGAGSLSFADLAFPAALTSGVAVAVQAGSVVANTSGGSPAAFTAVAGNAQLFALAVPDATAANGAYVVTIAPTPSGPFSSVQTTSTASNNAAAYAYPVMVASAGASNLTLTDFQFPQAFASLAVAAVQGGVLLGAPLTAAGMTTIHPAAGPLTVLVAATPGSSGKGLLGVDLATSPGGSVQLDQTQGVGAAFGTTTVTIATAGSYDVTLSDLGFPGNFADLSAVVTQGANRLGSIFEGGTFSFQAATGGDYVINVLGTPAAVKMNSQQSAGTYGISVAPTPPAPTATLSASADQVTSGGNVTLTWSSQNAASCTASGGWSGKLATSGTQSSGPLTVSTTFTIVCTSASNVQSQPQSVTVNIAPAPPGSGGGGALDVIGLLALSLALALGATDKFGSARRQRRL